jgi:hypothetical protein
VRRSKKKKTSASSPAPTPAERPFDKVPPDELEQIGRGFDAEDDEDAATIAPPADEPEEREPKKKKRDDDDERDDQAEDEELREPPPEALKFSEGLAYQGWSALNSRLEGTKWECSDKELLRLAKGSRRLVAQYLPIAGDGDLTPFQEMLVVTFFVFAPKAAKPSPKKPAAPAKPEQPAGPAEKAA